MSIAGTVIVGGCLAGARLLYTDRVNSLTIIILAASILSGLLYEGDEKGMDVVPSVVIIA